MERMCDGRSDDSKRDVGKDAKALSFNLAGHKLHSLFWENMTPPDSFEQPGEKVKSLLEDEFMTLARFRDEFTQAANTIEGSGWAALAYEPETERPMIMQIQNHNLRLVPELRLLLVLDMWEHAFYLDYQNDKKEYSKAFWKIVDWKKVGERVDEIQGRQGKNQW